MSELRSLPVIGERWGRGGERPSGSTEQVVAWLRAIPGSPNHCVIIETRPGEVYAFGFGRHDEPLPGVEAVRAYPLQQFLADWWRA
jgi:hypothetical protein